MPRQPNKSTARKAPRSTLTATEKYAPAFQFQSTEQWVESVSLRRRERPSALGVERSTPCRICGGPVSAAECPHREMAGGWRVHSACRRLRPRERLALLGLDVDAESVAVIVGARLLPKNYDDSWRTVDGERVMPEADDMPGKPWAHLPKDWKDDLLDRLPDLLIDAGLVESRCTDGACAWCGALQSTRWADYRQTWTDDGSKAALCRDCAAVADRRGMLPGAHPDTMRALAIEAATGSPTYNRDPNPPPLPMHAEVCPRDCDDGRPWHHVDAAALDRLRLDVWADYNGKHAPTEEDRQRALERRRAHEAASARAIAETEPYADLRPR